MVRVQFSRWRFFSGAIVQGAIIRGQFSGRGAIFLGVNCPRGNCPRGTHLGGNFRETIFLGCSCPRTHMKIRQFAV